MQPTACLLCHFEIGQSQKQVEGTPFVLLVMENIAYFTSLKRKKVIVFAVLYAASDVEGRLGQIMSKNSGPLG